MSIATYFENSSQLPRNHKRLSLHRIPLTHPVMSFPTIGDFPQASRLTGVPSSSNVGGPMCPHGFSIFLDQRFKVALVFFVVFLYVLICLSRVLLSLILRHEVSETDAIGAQHIFPVVVMSNLDFLSCFADFFC